MKGRARSRVWWPGIDQNIESVVASCEGGQGARANPPAVCYTLEYGPLDFGTENTLNLLVHS